MDGVTINNTESVAVPLCVSVCAGILPVPEAVAPEITAGD